jgi:hypothetical protein
MVLRELWLALAQYQDHRNKVEYAGGPVSLAEAKDLVQLTGKLQALLEKRLKRS